MAQKAREEATLCNLGAFPAKASHQIVYHVNERPKFHSIKIKFALFFWFNVCIVIWFEQSEQTKKLNVYVYSHATHALADALFMNTFASLYTSMRVTISGATYILMYTYTFQTPQITCLFDVLLSAAAMCLPTVNVI